MKVKVVILRILLLVASICPFINPLEAQQVSTCTELGLRPIEPGTGHDLLKLFLETDKFPERGCLVHHHPNGKDYIVTPNDWGESPIGERRVLIDDAFHAISVTREKYAAYGSLNSALFYIFDNVNRGHAAGTTYWIIEDACWMVSGVPNLFDTSGNNRQVFAHEIGHCFVMENVPNLRTYYNANNWFDESVSEFLSTVAYPENDLEFRFSTAYDLDGSSLQQPYKAYPLWHYFAKKKGREAVVPLMRTLSSYETKEERLGYLRSSGFDELYHHFLYEFYQNEIPDLGGGGNIPSEIDVNMIMEDITLIPGTAPPISLDSIPSERLSVFEFIIPADYDLLIKTPVNSSEKTFFSIVSENKKVKEWTRPEEIHGLCGSELRFYILASQLSGQTVRRTKFSYELKERTLCCEAGLVVDENPSEDELDGEFNFDYYIESYVNYKSEDDVGSIPMNYYVNSKDGSMLLTESWFTDNFGRSSSGGYKADAVIWLPNGQVVAYVYDTNFAQKRAITLALDQTRSDVMGVRAIKIGEFLREAPGSGISPPPLPPGSSWQGNASGAAYYQPEMSNPTDLNLVTAYISDATTSISSPLPSFGFMVGYVRDQNGANKKLVYTRYDTPNGEMIEAHLESIAKTCASFNGKGYKKMILGGGNVNAIATMTKEEQEAMVTSQKDYNTQIMALIQEIADCGSNDACIAEKNRQMQALVKEKRDAMYDLMSGPGGTGGAGSDFLNEQRAIRDQMFALKNQMIDKDMQCSRLNDANSSCGGCMQMQVERCQTEFESMEDDMRRLQCEILKLQGLGDTMEGCE